jgi:starch phosphorylase
MERYVPLPPLPGRISRLNELAYDLWWSWNPRAREVFRDLDYPLWRFTDHNPVLQLHLVEPERLEHAAGDPEFLQLYDEALAALDVVRAGAGTWSSRWAQEAQPVAWIAREFALHQSLPVDASGVGVLAGDVCKEASDLGVPLVGVALMYPRAYAHQRLSAEGWQQEAYEYIDWSDAPISPALCPDGSRCRFTVTVGGAPIEVVTWQVRAGRVSLFLLDTDRPDNAPWDRELSSTSFHEDPDGAMRQAVLLGAASVRALELLGVQPVMWHVADAAAGLLVLERLHRLVAGGSAYDDAAAAVGETTVFATRQPAAAREGGFTFSTLERHLAGTWPALAAHRDRILTLGHVETDRGSLFSTAALAARSAVVMTVPESAAGARAVDAWRAIRTGHAAGAAPEGVHAIADGVHVPGWVSTDLAAVFDRHVGEDWRERQDDEAAWAVLRDVPDAEIWEVRQRLRGYLVDFVRERARRRWSREQASGNRLVALGTLLDARSLTIGYARRFTGDARPELVFQDVERLARLVTAARRPVQIVFAGKAHPNDEAGKHHVQRVFRRALDPSFGGRIAFVEDYDLHVARLLVQGCDVWLSTPRRGSPPSIGGLIASVNGVAHLATPDGWWAGGCTGTNGWIADGGQASDPRAQDAADARAVYAILEEAIVPAFYDRPRHGVPPRWAAVVKEAIATTLPRFCARRAVKSLAEAGTRAVAARRR